MKKLMLLSAICILASCSSTKVTSDQASNTNFSNYSTFELVQQTNGANHSVNAINAKRVEDAIQYESRMRGLSESEEADLQIVWGVGFDTQTSYSTQTNHYRNGAGFRPRYGGMGSASSYSDTQEYTSTSGILQIALVDKSTEEVLWIGTATDEFKGNNKKAEEKINKVIAKVFEEFPISKYRS